MEDFERKDFAKILKSNHQEMNSWVKDYDTDTFRVYDRVIDSIPVTVDCYSKYVLITDYSDGNLTDGELEEIVDLTSRFLYVQRDRIFLKEKKKREGREQHTKRDDSLLVEVSENGLKFEVDLLKYADTGLFLDQRLNREMIRNISEGKNVLNLFSYTGSFSVYAARGGAESVTSVDLSRVYTSWADRNLNLNGYLDRERFKLVAMDAEKFIDERIKDNTKYEIVIFDPPSFSNSHKAEDFDVQKDYKRYISKIYYLLVKGGLLLFSENLWGFGFSKKEFEPFFNIREITKINMPEGFSSRKGNPRVWMMIKSKDIEELTMEEKEGVERLTLDDGETVRRRDDRKRRESSSNRGNREYSKDRKGDSYRSNRSSDRDRRGSYSSERGGRYNSSRDSYSDRDTYSERRSYNDRDYDRDRSYNSNNRSSSRGDYNRDRSYRSNDGDRSYRSNDRDRSYRSNDRNRSYNSSDRDRSYRSNDRDRSYRSNSDRSSRYDDRDRSYRDYDRDSSSSRNSGGNSYRDRDRSSRSSRDRSYNSDDRRSNSSDRRSYYDSSSGENDTSRAYRESRESDSSYPRERREKKSSPKPFGYDNFVENKSREKATTFWIQNQEYEEDPSED